MKHGFFVFKAEGRETFLKYFQSFTCIYRIYGIYLHHDYNKHQQHDTH